MGCGRRSRAKLKIRRNQILSLYRYRFAPVQFEPLRFFAWLRTPPSALFARYLLTFVTTFWDKDAKALVLPDDDEIGKAIKVTGGGQIVHPGLQG